MNAKLPLYLLVVLAAVSMGQAAEQEPQLHRLPVVPSEKEQAEALHTIRDVYREEYASLRRSDSRAALANEFIHIARGTVEDPAVRFVLLAEARRLAVDGNAPAIALVAAQETIESFRLGPPNHSEEQIAAGDKSWIAAEKESGRAALKLRIQAASWYLRALGQAEGFDKLKIEKRLATLGDGQPPVLPEGRPRYFTHVELRKMFGLEGWQVDGDALCGKVGVFENREGHYSTTSYRCSSLDFGFKIKARWYHIIRLNVDGKFYLFSRGHWANEGTLLLHGGLGQAVVYRRPGPRVDAPKQWHSMRAVVSQNRLSFYYDDELQWQGPLAADPSHGQHTIRVGCGCHQTTVCIKDMYVSAR